MTRFSIGLAGVPFINLKKIVYGPENKEAAVPGHRFTQLDPGTTIFSALKEYALSRGLLFYAQPDGTFIFGEPAGRGSADFRFIARKDGRGNNVLEGSLSEDISKRYSQVTVLGQQQGDEATAKDKINVNHTAGDPDFPFHKPFVMQSNNDQSSPKRLAKHKLEKMRTQGFVLSYKVPGHSQNGLNYGINRLAHVDDEILGISGDYLIRDRTLEMSQEGIYTTLKLGYPGVMLDD